MYGRYLTAKVKAKRQYDGVDTVVLNPEGWDALRRPDRLVRDSLSDRAPIRFGMVGDFEVGQTTQYQSYVLAEDGTKVFFDYDGVSA